MLVLNEDQDILPPSFDTAAWVLMGKKNRGEEKEFFYWCPGNNEVFLVTELIQLPLFS